MTASQLPQPNVARRHMIEVFLGGGLLASFLSFVYPGISGKIPARISLCHRPTHFAGLPSHTYRPWS